MSDIDGPDRQTAMLTRTDRRFLAVGGKGYDRKQRYDRKSSIVPRVRHSLADFQLLCEGLPTEWWDEIFDVTSLEELGELEDDVAAAITSLYVGMGGFSEFRRPLQYGIKKGEVAMGNAETAAEMHVRFDVERFPRTTSDVINRVENREWNGLRSHELLAFVQLAHRAGAIDSDAIHQQFAEEKQRKEYIEAQRAQDVESN